MPPIIYTRGFTHTDWLDNVDRVQAGGGNGFNGRFHLLETEFDTISGVIKQISDTLLQLGQAPPPQPTPVTFTPTLTPTSANGWSHREGLAEKPANAATADGMMSVQLPNGAHITQLRAVGRSAQAAGSGAVANLRIRLRRQALTGATAAVSESIATVSVDGPQDPFDQLTNTITANTDRIDVSTFRYFITATLAAAGPLDPVQLFAFQVTTIASS